MLNKKMFKINGKESAKKVEEKLSRGAKADKVKTDQEQVANFIKINQKMLKLRLYDSKEKSND